MIFFHISHNDLDGYGCHLVSKKLFPNGNFYNANYGSEVKNSINTVLEKFEDIEDEILFLISDLNLTLDESRSLNKKINHLNKNGKNIKLQLLDHHGTGKPSSEKYDWYFLDVSRCATKIVFDYFIENFEEYDALCSDDFKKLIEAIDDVDIWHENDEYFEFGKVIMRMVSNTFEINATMFPAENRDYRHALLLKSLDYINKENSNILYDDDMHSLKKEYLMLDDKTDTIDNLSAKYLVHLLENKKEELEILYKGHKGILTFTLSNISIPANTFLKYNPDYDFFINIGRRGSAGFRADGKVDVSLLAQKLAGGGGHPNASGAAFKDFKDISKYEDVKKFLINKIDLIS
jgi:oligoribonuclease NrnB/cAMP/cGMP phosphodiesterase (DHH superfamily)